MASRPKRPHSDIDDSREYRLSWLPQRQPTPKRSRNVGDRRHQSATTPASQGGVQSSSLERIPLRAPAPRSPRSAAVGFQNNTVVGGSYGASSNFPTLNDEIATPQIVMFPPIPEDSPFPRLPESISDQGTGHNVVARAHIPYHTAQAPVASHFREESRSNPQNWFFPGPEEGTTRSEPYVGRSVASETQDQGNTPSADNQYDVLPGAAETVTLSPFPNLPDFNFEPRGDPFGVGPSITMQAFAVQESAPIANEDAMEIFPELEALGGDAMSISVSGPSRTSMSVVPQQPGTPVVPGSTGQSDVSMRLSAQPSASHDNDQEEEPEDMYRFRKRPYPPMVIGFTNAHTRPRKDQETKNLQASVRQMMREELGFGAKNEPVLPHPPASVGDIANFLNGGPGPTMDYLQLDFATTADGIRSQWNINAATLFAAVFIARVREANFDEDAFKDDDLTVPHIRSLFLSRIRYFMQLYRQVYFPVPAAIRKLRKKLDRRISRRNSLYRLRRRVCVQEEADLGAIFDRIDDEVISEDETDTELSRRAGLKVFRRVEKGWVNPELTRILHEVLDVHLHRLNLFGEFGAGNQFRQRVNHPPGRVTWTGVVVGLPINFYNPTWLEGLMPEEREALKCAASVDLQPFLARLRRRPCCYGRSQRERSRNGL